MAKHQDLDTTFQFFNEIGIINQLASNAFEAELPLGLTVSQFSVLNWFTRVDDEATPGRLATAFNVTKGAMTNTLKRLEQKGFIDVRVDQASARRKLVTMTPAGADARRQALEAVEPLLEEMLKAFSLQDIQRSLPFLAQLRVYLDERRYQN
ncbi:MAG: MarR family winged helix-turn-helix transcriptional regulator [Pseudomonadales bacterium]